MLFWALESPGLRWVEIGRGTAAVTETILERTDPSKVTGVEPPEGFLSQAWVNITDRRADFKSDDAMSIPFNDAEADISVSGLVLNFVPGTQAGLQEMCRTVRTRGTVPLYAWDYAGEKPLMLFLECSLWIVS